MLVSAGISQCWCLQESVLVSAEICVGVCRNQSVLVCAVISRFWCWEDSKNVSVSILNYGFVLGDNKERDGYSYLQGI